MSRATDVRDEIVTSIAAEMTDHRVEPFSLLLYERDELLAKPLILVRFAGREYSAEQGPDEQLILIDVLLCAAIPPKTGNDYAEYRRELVSAFDDFDDQFETLINLWVPNGEFSKTGMADHRFVSIEKIVGFEMDELYSDGVYLSWLQLRYQDCLDEG